ncbi:hypothetical protein HGA91_06200 [candidate division WWE3 bacterium]|nr:hypothetical protein [candidate division WWE3 bacterium]
MSQASNSAPALLNHQMVVATIWKIVNMIGKDHFALCEDDWSNQPIIEVGLTSNGFRFEIEKRAHVDVYIWQGVVFFVVGPPDKGWNSSGMVNPVYDPQPRRLFDEVVDYLLMQP